MTHSSLKICVALLGAALASACAINQPSPSAGDRQVSQVTVQQARAASDSTLAEKNLIRWGGTIAGVENRADGQTMLELVSRPLLGGGRPVHNDRSDGRFLALISTFLDPEIVKVGRDLTVLGTLDRLENGKVGESDYVYPLVLAENYRYWKPRVIVKQTHFPHANVHYFPHRRYDPFWDSWPFPPRKPRH